MARVEQAIDLRTVQAEAPLEVGLAQVLRAHGPVQHGLKRRLGGQDDAGDLRGVLDRGLGLLPGSWRRGERDIGAAGDAGRNGLFDGVARMAQRIRLVAAEGRDLRQVGATSSVPVSSGVSRTA